MKPTPDRERFLRAAIKTGLRIQDRFEAQGEAGTPKMRSEGVATLEKIRASLRRRASNPASRR